MFPAFFVVGTVVAIKQTKEQQNMNNRINKTANDNDKAEAWRAYVAKRRTGAPSHIYLFLVMGALAICGMSIIAFVHFVIEGQDGTFNPSAWQQWKEIHQIRYYLIGLIMAVVDVAVLDVFGWKIASWIAWWRYRENITERRVAVWRLAVQFSFAILMVLLFTLFPTAFPHPHGRPPYVGLGILCAPMVLAATQWFRAEKDR